MTPACRPSGAKNDRVGSLRTADLNSIAMEVPPEMSFFSFFTRLFDRFMKLVHVITRPWNGKHTCNYPKKPPRKPKCPKRRKRPKK